MLVVRRYEGTDHLAVWNLHRLGVQQTGADLGTGPWEDDLRSAESVAAAYLVEGGDILVGVVGSELVALGALRPHDGWVEIKRMRVHPKWQRRGYGQRMLEELEERAGKLGHSTIRLDTTTLQRAAIALYVRNGYEEIGRRRRGPLEEILFEKQLMASNGGEGVR